MEHPFGAGDLTFHQEAEHAFIFGKELGNYCGGGVGSVGGAKGVVDIDVTKFRQPFGEVLIAFLFLL